MARINTKFNYRIKKKANNAPKSNNISRLKDAKEIINVQTKNSNKKITLRKKIESKPVVASKNIRVSKIAKKSVKTNISKNPKVRGQADISSIQDYISDKKVLILGNSGEITTSSLGSQIDSYDCVVRINHGVPIAKYFPHMGRKIDIWAHGFSNHAVQIKTYNLISKRIAFHVETCERKFCKKICNSQSFMIPSSWYKDEFDKRTGFEMSTGLNTIIFFVDHIQTMKSIGIVGFDFLKTSNRVLKSGRAIWHNSSIEEKTITEMLNNCSSYVPFSEKYNFAK